MSESQPPRTCNKCMLEKPLDGEHFRPAADCRGGFRPDCRACENKAFSARRRGQPVSPDDVSADQFKAELERLKQAKADQERLEREDSKYAQLKANDFPEFDDVERKAGIGRGTHDREADKQKKQEYAKQMGIFSDHLGAGQMDENDGKYLARLAVEEERYGNRRTARSISLSAAHEALHLKHLMKMAREHLYNKIEPKGYALDPPVLGLERAVVTHWSDWHVKSDLLARDNPEAYGAEEESRSIAKVVYEVANYKPDHRGDTRLIILMNGDMVEGNLGNDRRDGAPLAEQKVAFWSYAVRAIGYLAQAFKHVHIECQPGNHGRDIIRHPGRATSSKWDGHEWEMYYALSMMCVGLKNVTWSMPMMAVSTVILPGGHKLLQSHGDTEVKLKDPDAGAKDNANILAMINATKIYGHEYAVGCFGHFHKGRDLPYIAMHALFNPALVPPNGHARTEGYINERRGQTIFESTPDFPVGDRRIVFLNKSTDSDAKLNELIPPFRLP